MPKRDKGRRGNATGLLNRVALLGQLHSLAIFTLVKNMLLFLIRGQVDLKVISDTAVADREL